MRDHDRDYQLKREETSDQVYRIEIWCNGELTSSEAIPFISQWRSLSETVAGCPPYDAEYTPKNAFRIGNKLCIIFKDGTKITTEPVQ